MDRERNWELRSILSKNVSHDEDDEYMMLVDVRSYAMNGGINFMVLLWETVIKSVPFGLGKWEQVQVVPLAAQAWYCPPTVIPSTNLTNLSAAPEMGCRSERNMCLRLISVMNQVANSWPFSPAPNAQFSHMLPPLKEKR
eukprot:Gb_35916 [translate_table: standard]